MVLKPSTAIGYKSAQSIYYASREVATWIGQPLNTLITLKFDLTTVQAEHAVPIFGKIRMNRFNKWISRPQKGAGAPSKATYIYAFENVKDGKPLYEINENLPHNVHVHWYAHIPPNRHFDFENRLVGWLDSVTGEKSAANAVRVQKIPEDRGVSRYLLKGTHPHVAERFGAKNVHAPQGLIIGKRSGVSMNIGPKARKKMDFDKGIDRRSRLKFAA